MNSFRIVYEALQPRFDPQGFALFHAAENILGKTIDDPALVSASGFDKLSLLMRENATLIGGKDAIGCPMTCVIDINNPEFQAFADKMYAKALYLMNKKYLFIIQNANSQLRLARVYRREHTYTKTHPLTKDEAVTALQFGLRVDAISAKEDYHGATADGFMKERMSLKSLKVFYDDHDVHFEHCDEVLYLSPDYAMAKCIMDDIMYAIHYFVEKEDALNWANLVETPILYLTIGMPGAGKSTLSAKLDAEVYSSDSIRKELTGDVCGETKGAVEFYLMNLRTQQALRAGLNVVSDATSLSKKARHSAMKNVEGIPHKTIGLFFNCLREDSDCRNLNPDRDKHVPDDALERLWGNIEVPEMDEGFDELYDIIVFQ